jgi:hypothetical protein
MQANQQNTKSDVNDVRQCLLEFLSHLAFAAV